MYQGWFIYDKHITLSYNKLIMSLHDIILWVFTGPEDPCLGLLNHKMDP